MHGISTGPSAPAVVQLITGLGVGGAERVVLELSGRLTTLGCRVIVVALNGDGSLLRQYRDLTFPIRLLNTSKVNPFAAFRGLATLMQLLRNERVAVLHAHMFHALLVSLICCLMRPKLKIVFTSHSFSGFSAVRRWLITRTRLFRSADIVFARGQHQAQNAEHSFVIPNGVSVRADAHAKSRRATDKRVFLSIGRLEKPKNPLGLIEAFHAMKHQSCELWIAGDGTLRKDVERRVASLGLHGRVKMFGVQDNVSHLLREADCFVMASSWEGLPMALLEAGAVALPVVATPVGAIPNLLCGNCGYLTPLEDMSKALDSVVDDYDAAVERGGRLRERIAALYSQDIAAKRHRRLYLRLAKL